MNRFTLARRRRSARRRRRRQAAGGRHASRRSPRRSTRCADADIVVFSGGSSVGERDLIVDLDRGARRDDLSRHRRQARQADRVRARCANGTPFFGMPGNPTSCLSNAYVLLVPFLRAAARLPPLRRPHGSRAAGPAHRVASRTASVLHGATRSRRRGAGVQGSGDITSLSQADGYIEIPADQSIVEEGDEVEVTLF